MTFAKLRVSGLLLVFGGGGRGRGGLGDGDRWGLRLQRLAKSGSGFWELESLD